MDLIYFDAIFVHIASPSCPSAREDSLNDESAVDRIDCPDWRPPRFTEAMDLKPEDPRPCLT